MSNKKILIEMDFFKKIKQTVKNGIEGAFELALNVFASVNRFSQTAKNLKVSVRISNVVETSDPQRKFSLFAQKTWTDLFSERERCELKPPANIQDILFIICIKDDKLAVDVKSEYLEKQDPKSEIGKTFKEFIEEANEIIDEAFDRDRSMSLDANIASFNKTKQVTELKEFFEERLRKLFFAVLVKKFVAEVSN